MDVSPGSYAPAFMDGDRAKAGREGEALAEAHLVREGYEILARNFTCRYGELDLVASRGELLVVVEVRLRSSAVWGDPALTISRAKQRRVVKATLHFLRAHGLFERMIRFDVIAIIGRGDAAALEHLPDAFDAGM